MCIGTILKGSKVLMNKIIYTAIVISCIFLVTISFYHFEVKSFETKGFETINLERDGRNSKGSILNDLPKPEHALYYPQAKEIKGFNLTDHQGKPFSKDQLMNKWSLVFLGYTSCPHICSPTLQNLHFIHNDLKKVAPNTEVLLISVDPKRDSQAVLSEFVSYFNPHFKALRAEHDVLFPLVRSLGLSYAFSEVEADVVADDENEPEVSSEQASSEQASGEANDPYWVDHSAALILLNPKGQISAVFRPEKSADQSTNMNNEQLLSDYQKIINLYKYENG